MSQRFNPAPAEAVAAIGASSPRLESYPNRETTLGSLTIARALPVRDRRLVGPWCFLDRFGPLSFTEGKPMDVAPHPHMGLQTVTWLLEPWDRRRTRRLLPRHGVGPRNAQLLVEHLR